MNKLLEKIKNEETINNAEEKLLNNYLLHFKKENNILNINFNDDKEIDNFININKLSFKHNSELENLNESAELFVKYLKEHKKIYILTDNDLDGTSARSIALAFELYLKRKYKYKYIYEHIFTYGRTHGITFEQVDNIMKNNVTDDILFITADNGINNKKELIEIKNKYKNIKIIITDHHLSNEEDNVFDIADLVLDPEATYNSEKSKYLTIKDDKNNIIKQSSYSGAYVFYLLIKKVMEKLKITNTELEKEMKMIALFSNIGDIIEYNLDIVQDMYINKKDFFDIYLLNNYISNFNFFEQFPEEKQVLKLNEFISKIISIFNSTRRLSSILSNFHNLDKKDFKQWMLEKFEIDIEKEELNGESLLDYLTNLNNRSKKIYIEYFEVEDEKINSEKHKNIHFSYIKEMAVLILLSKNKLKTSKDNIFMSEVYHIIDKLNKFKNYLKKHIVDNELYFTNKKELFEIFYSKKDTYLREILSIQAFIEANKNKSYMTLAKNIDTETGLTMINGSFRSKDYLSFKYYLQENDKVKELLKKYNISVTILGHDKAAGIFFKSNNNKNLEIEILNNFFEDFHEILKKDNVKVIEEDKYYLNIKDLKQIDVEKMLRILKKYLYITPHPHFKNIMFNIKKQDIKEYVSDNLELKISKSGVKYFNIKDIKNNTFLYFENEKSDIKLKDIKEFKTELNVKFNSKTNNYFYEMILNPIY